MNKFAISIGSWLLLSVALLLTVLVYWSGLRGGFVYDDSSFVTGNAGIQVTSNSLQQWFAALISFPSGAHQGRWLGMLSFGLNHYFTGLDPYAFKLTNLCIHLFNGLLVFLALRALFNFHLARSPTTEATRFNPAMVAACIAGLWLVLPINLTSVLYVSQRLESLSNTFVFLGLWLYLHARIAERDGPRKTAFIWFSLIACTGLGTLVKESAILLPLYTALVEFVLTGWRTRDGRWNRSLLALYATLLAVPFAIGLVWLAGWVDGTRSFGRSFDIPQRLMTEARVLFEYMRWTLVPSLDALTLYHDDIHVSQGWFSPATTFFSLIGIASLVGVAVWKHRSMPMFSLGVLWYFGGHALTATVIPLMLAFEHRNYFPSLGLLLASVALLTVEGFRLRARTAMLAFIALFTFYAFTTALRSIEWSDPLRLAFSEATKRPKSPAAQYDLASRLLSGLKRSDGQSMSEDAILILDTARKLPDASIAFEQLLITSHAKNHRPIMQEWWLSLIRKIESRPVNASDTKALHLMNICFIDKMCTDGIDFLKQAYAAAMAHGSPTPQLLNVHAEYAWYVLDDREMGERDIRAATLALPQDFNARRNLVILLLAKGQLDDAEAELAVLRNQNRFGFFDDLIGILQNALREKRQNSNASISPKPALEKEGALIDIASPTSNENPTVHEDSTQ
jgi:hypothetical protein